MVAFNLLKSNSNPAAFTVSFLILGGESKVPMVDFPLTSISPTKALKGFSLAKCKVRNPVASNM